MKLNIEIKDLDQLRKLKGLKYKDIDKHISWGTFHGIVNGKTKASDKSIEKMCELFDVTETDIKGLLKK